VSGNRGSGPCFARMSDSYSSQRGGVSESYSNGEGGAMILPNLLIAFSPRRVTAVTFTQSCYSTLTIGASAFTVAELSQP
jgi:hypothetical protein